MPHLHVFPTPWYPGSSSSQHLAAPLLPQCFLKPLTQSWQFGCNPQAVWAYTLQHQPLLPHFSPQPPPHTCWEARLPSLTAVQASGLSLAQRGTRSQQSQAFRTPGCSSALQWCLNPLCTSSLLCWTNPLLSHHQPLLIPTWGFVSHGLPDTDTQRPMHTCLSASAHLPPRGLFLLAR